MNKKIPTELAVGIILIIAVVIGGIFWMQNKKEDKTIQMPAKKIDNANNNLTSSNYGFNFAVPDGWHIWEGNSAASDLMNKPEFASVLENGVSALTNQKIKEYQMFMDNWKVESSEFVVFTDSKTLDYKNRNFSDAGKIMSRMVDEDILKQRDVSMYISTSEVNLNDAPVNDEKKESRNIKVDSNDARLLISKSLKLVDWVIIKIPIKSEKTISGKKASSLVFMEYVKKNDSSGIDKLIFFISSLNIFGN
jgi:hypothetical protein